MLTIPPEYTTKCEKAGKVSTLNYGEKSLLLYSPIEPATHILYLIHGGGGDQNSFFRPEFLYNGPHVKTTSKKILVNGRFVRRRQAALKSSSAKVP